jgi:LysM repeat protein
MTTEQGEAVFISGAVDAQNIEFDMNECSFTEKVWSEIYEEIKEYFPDLTVVGWFLSRMGFSVAINERIQKLHMDNFPGSDKVLYVTDSLESEDAFYLYQKGQMVKQKGYYIYYAKNEQMQNYIISKRGEENMEEKNDIRRKDSELLKSYREKNNELREARENTIGIGYVVGGFLTLAVMAMGITIAGNYRKMQNMEVSINRLELTSDVTETNTAAEATIIPPEELEDLDAEAEVSVKDEDAEPVSGQAEADITSEDYAAGDSEGNSAENSESGSGEENSGQISDTVEVDSTGGSIVYQVRQGDTLTSIALAYYGTISSIDDIALANSIDDEYTIYEGESIVLPNVN